MSSFPSFRLLIAFALLASAGCGGRVDSTPQSEREDSEREAMGAGPPMRLLLVDDSPLGEALRRRWAARTEGELQIEESSTEELLARSRKRPEVDVIIYPAGLLGELVDRKWIQPVDRKRLSATAFDRSDILQLVRLRETFWGDACYAIPMGSPVYLLVYRRDRFDQLGLKPPATWAEYHQVAAKLRAAADEAEGLATVEPLAAGWAGQTFLARAAPYTRHGDVFSTVFDYKTMAPKIAETPFLRALQEMVACHALAPDGPLVATPAEAYREVADGRAGMALTWPTSSDAQGGSSLGFAELPGSPDVFNFDEQAWEPRRTGDPGRVPLLSISGRLGSVSTAARQASQATAMLTLLASEDWSAAISTKSSATAPFRAAHLEDAGRWTGLGEAAAERYGEAMRATLSRNAWMFSPRIPGRKRYLDALDEAVLSAVRKQATPEAALQKAAAAWREITEELGLKTQQAAFHDSLTR